MTSSSALTRVLVWLVVLALVAWVFFAAGERPDEGADSGVDGEISSGSDLDAVRGGESTVGDSEPGAASGTESADPPRTRPADAAALTASVFHEDGSPAAGGRVTLRRNEVSLESRSNRRGVASFGTIPPGEYSVTLEFPGPVSRSTRRPVRFLPGESRSLRFFLRPLDRAITGRVLDGAGRPVNEAEINWSMLGLLPNEPELATSGALERVVTGADGAFAITNLDAVEYRIRATRGEYEASLPRQVLAPASDLALVLHRESRFIVSGTVADESGSPIPGVGITGTGGERTTTDESGRYELDVLYTTAPGFQIAITAKKAGYGDRYKSVAPGDRPTGSRLDVSFELTKVSDLGVLRGILAGADGTVVPGESLHLASESRQTRYQAVANADGSFRFDEVRIADDYVLTVYPAHTYADRAIEDLSVSLGMHRVDVTLEPIAIGNLNVTLVDGAAQPIPDFALFIRSARARANSAAVTSGTDGRFRAEGVPAGELTLETRTTPKVTVRGLRLEPGRELSATVPIGVGDRRVTGRVKLPNDSPVGGARIVVSWSQRTEWIQSTLYAQTITDAAGRFTVSGFGPGACTVTASGVALRPARATIEIPPDGDPAPVELEVR